MREEKCVVFGSRCCCSRFVVGKSMVAMGLGFRRPLHNGSPSCEAAVSTDPYVPTEVLWRSDGLNCSK